MAKDFTTINTEKQETGVTTGEVFASIERGKNTYRQQGTASKEEQLERANSLRTQGRKGCKVSRLNMAFTPENRRFIKIMSQVTGQNMTEFTNYIITRYREEHPDLYTMAEAILDKVNDGQGEEYGR